MLRITTSITFALVAGLVAVAQAAPEIHETTVHDTTTAVEIKLDDSTVLCSAADYGALFLKVGIPQLAAITLLDHQNIGAGAPCVAAGACEAGHMPENIIDASRPTETVDIRVQAVRVDEADAAAQTCSTYLVERVNLTIRGFAFTHERSVELGSRPFADCNVAAPAAGSGDTKSDSYGAAEPPSSGGCSTSNGASMLPLALGLLAFRRRRRP